MLTITPLHIERGREMRQVVRHDIAMRGMTFEAAVESLASFLGIEADAVKLAIAIANDAENSEPLLPPRPLTSRCDAARVGIARQRQRERRWRR